MEISVKRPFAAIALLASKLFFSIFLVMACQNI